MAPPAVYRQQRGAAKVAGTYIGQVTALTTGYRARVTIGSGTVSAAIPSAHRAVQVNDSVQVTWQGGDPVVTDVITRHDPPAYTAAPGVTTRRSMPNPPPTVTGSDLPGSSATFDTVLDSIMLTWNANWTVDQKLNYLRDYTVILRNYAVALAGDTNTLKQNHDTAVDRTNVAYAATKDLVTTVKEVRDYSDTQTADLAVQAITAH